MNGKRAKALRKAATNMMDMTGAEGSRHKDYKDWEVGIARVFNNGFQSRMVRYKEGTFGYHLRKLKKLYYDLSVVDKLRAHQFMQRQINLDTLGKFN